MPERDTLRIARAQHLTKLLERDRRFADLPNFVERVRALSPAPLKKDIALSALSVKGSKVDPRHALIAAVLNKFTEKDFSDPAKRAKYRKLRQLQLEAAELARGRGRKKVSPPGADMRQFNPTGKNFAYTIHGNRAALRTGVRTWQRFFMPLAVVPCIQRKMRREVMFANKKAGSGYRSRKRRNWASGIPC